MTIQPIELLQIKLRKYEGALAHSKLSFEKTNVSKDLYETYVNNLNILIREYKLAIRVLNSYM